MKQEKHFIKLSTKRLERRHYWVWFWYSNEKKCKVLSCLKGLIVEMCFEWKTGIVFVNQFLWKWKRGVQVEFSESWSVLSNYQVFCWYDFAYFVVYGECLVAMYTSLIKKNSSMFLQCSRNPCNAVESVCVVVQWLSLLLNFIQQSLN